MYCQKRFNKLVHFEQTVLLPGPLQRILHGLHVPKNLFLLPATPNHLDSGRETGHLLCIVVHPCSSSDAMVATQLSQDGLVSILTANSQRVALGIDVANGNNASGIVEQVPQKRVSTRGYGIMHRSVRESRSRITGAKDEIELLRFRIPPGVPGLSEGLSLEDESPQLCR